VDLQNMLPLTFQLRLPQPTPPHGCGGHLSRTLTRVLLDSLALVEYTPAQIHVSILETAFSPRRQFCLPAPRYRLARPPAGSRPRLLDEENLIYLRQVLGSQFGIIHPRVDLLFESIETTAQGTWERRCGRQHEAKTGPQNPGIGAGAKDRNPESEVGEAV